MDEGLRQVAAGAAEPGGVDTAAGVVEHGGVDTAAVPDEHGSVDGAAGHQVPYVHVDVQFNQEEI